MPQRFLDSDEATFGGVMTWVSLGFVKIWEYMTLENINNVLELFMVLGGAIFLWYKIQGQILDNKKKKKDLNE